MSRRKFVVVGASAGGVEAVMTLAASLPSDLAAPVAVVIHMPAESPSLLAQILTRKGSLKAKQAEDGEQLRNGTIFVPLPDHHLMVDVDGTLRTPRGPSENRHRPAIDPLFRSAALAFGPDTIGVVLSGNLDDGTAGLISIKKCGGVAIVQDPDDALYPGMPQSAIENADVDHILPVSRIARQIVESLAQDRPATRIDRRLIAMEKKIAEFTREGLESDERPGTPSAFSCPDCGGVLWEIDDGDFVRYRCRVGHAFSPETMLGAQADVLDEALMAALKTLEETARLSRRLSDTERRRGHDWMAARFAEREREARDRAETIRRFIEASSSTVPIETQPAQTKSRS